MTAPICPTPSIPPLDCSTVVISVEDLPPPQSPVSTSSAAASSSPDFDPADADREFSDVSSLRSYELNSDDDDTLLDDEQVRGLRSSAWMTVESRTSSHSHDSTTRSSGLSEISSVSTSSASDIHVDDASSLIDDDVDDASSLIDDDVDDASSLIYDDVDSDGEANYGRTEEDSLGGSYADLEPSLHSDPTVSNSTVSHGRTVDPFPSTSGSPVDPLGTLVDSQYQLEFPDPANVSSSFSFSSSFASLPFTDPDRTESTSGEFQTGSVDGLDSLYDSQSTFDNPRNDARSLTDTASFLTEATYGSATTPSASVHVPKAVVDGQTRSAQTTGKLPRSPGSTPREDKVQFKLPRRVRVIVHAPAVLTLEQHRQIWGKVRVGLILALDKDGRYLVRDPEKGVFEVLRRLDEDDVRAAEKVSPFQDVVMTVTMNALKDQASVKEKSVDGAGESPETPLVVNLKQLPSEDDLLPLPLLSESCATQLWRDLLVQKPDLDWKSWTEKAKTLGPILAPLFTASGVVLALLHSRSTTLSQSASPTALTVTSSTILPASLAVPAVPFEQATSVSKAGLRPAPSDKSVAEEYVPVDMEPLTKALPVYSVVSKERAGTTSSSAPHSGKSSAPDLDPQPLKKTVDVDHKHQSVSLSSQTTPSSAKQSAPSSPTTAFAVVEETDGNVESASYSGLSLPANWTGSRVLALLAQANATQIWTDFRRAELDHLHHLEVVLGEHARLILESVQKSLRPVVESVMTTYQSLLPAFYRGLDAYRSLWGAKTAFVAPARKAVDTELWLAHRGANRLARNLQTAISLWTNATLFHVEPPAPPPKEYAHATSLSQQLLHQVREVARVTHKEFGPSSAHARERGRKVFEDGKKVRDRKLRDARRGLQKLRQKGEALKQGFMDSSCWEAEDKGKKQGRGKKRTCSWSEMGAKQKSRR